MRTLIMSAFLKLFVFDEAVSNLARLIFCNMLKTNYKAITFTSLGNVSDAYISLPYCQLKQKSLSDAFGATERLFYVTLQDARFIKRSLPCQLQP